MNIVSLALAITIVYRISRSLIDNQRANIFSVITSRYAFTFLHPLIFSGGRSNLLRIGGVGVEGRGIPVFERFCNVNCLPPGLVFYLLGLWAAILVFRDRTAKRG